MNKKVLWCFNAILAVVIAILIYVQFRKPSPQPYYRNLEVVAKSVAEYHTTHNVLPESLSDLGNAALTSFRGNAVSYSNDVSTFTLSIAIPFECGPKPGTLGAPSLPKGSRHLRTVIAQHYSIEE